MYWAIQKIANVVEVNTSSNGSFVRGFIFEMILLHRDVDSNCLVVVLSSYTVAVVIVASSKDE